MNVQDAINDGLATNVSTLSGQNVDIIACELGLTIESYLGQEKIGEMLFKSLESGISPPIVVIKLCSMEIREEFRRQGIGVAMVKWAREVSGYEVVASCPSNTEELTDGSHLINDGPGFVEKMRREGLIMRGCCEPCYCEDGMDPEEYEYMDLEED